MNLSNVMWSLARARTRAAKSTELVEAAGLVGWDRSIENSVVLEGLTSVLININKQYGSRICEDQDHQGESKVNASYFVLRIAVSRSTKYEMHNMPLTLTPLSIPHPRHGDNLADIVLIHYKKIKSNFKITIFLFSHRRSFPKPSGR
ncbi:MAG: hypothetical protein U0V48_12250 [Anaerolineales bacterium]